MKKITYHPEAIPPHANAEELAPSDKPADDIVAGSPGLGSATRSRSYSPFDDPQEYHESFA